MPKVSVIMSTYNDSKYIRESIDSILAQTFKDFEFIIIDDASQDDTVAIIESYNDPRIILIKNDENHGLTSNLNKAISYVRGKYIARMDGDDISHIDRLQKQVSYMDEHKDVYLIGSAVHSFGASNLNWILPDDSEELRIRMLIRPVFAHPSFMFRTELVKLGFNYNETFRTAQDYEFAARVSTKYRIGRVKDILLDYRVHEKQISNISGKNQRSNADRVRERQLFSMGVVLSDSEREIYDSWVEEKRLASASMYKKAYVIIDKFISQNKLYKMYDEKKMEVVLKKMLYTWVIRSRRLGYVIQFPRICNFRFHNMMIFIGEIIRTIREKRVKTV